MTLIVAAAIMGYLATGLPGGAPGNYGPEVFPLIISTIAVLNGLGLVARKAHQGVTSPDGAGEENLTWVNGIAVVGSLVYAIYAMPAFGYFFTVFPILVLLMAVFRCRWIGILPIAFVSTIAIKHAFVDLLAVPLPSAAFMPF